MPGRSLRVTASLLTCPVHRKRQSNIKRPLRFTCGTTASGEIFNLAGGVAFNGFPGDDARKPCVHLVGHVLQN
eukprot:scaffold326894_cov24-Attheya_sp.AAC.1